jgi:hypothetical protein
MNERIQELAEQAGLEFDDDLSLEPEPIYYTTQKDLKKFAELIVQECITQCEQVATDANAMTKSKFVTDAGLVLHEGAWGGAKNCSEQIKQHFGVEE